MKLSIHHRTSYSFPSEVVLEPHTARLWPRVDPGVRLLEIDLEIEPTPVVRAHNLDKEGNSVVEVWFDGPTSRLTFDSRIDVETLVTNPFSFLATNPEWKLPYIYPPGWGPTLAPYRRSPDQVTGPVREIALRVAAETKRGQLEFPLVLARTIRRDFEVERRGHGDPKPALETARSGRGACRDIAVLFVDCCRAMGLAARFVSGYVYDPDAEPELHAWAEVYLPGGGWRGYDPTYGLAVADWHVVLAAAADPAEAAVVSGAYRGGDVTAELKTALSVTEQP